MSQWIERVYTDHRQGLYGLALAILGLREDAEDAVHDAFARLCCRETNGLADPVAYAYAAVRNAALDRVRSCRAATVMVDRLFRSAPCPGGSPVETLVRQEQDRQVQAAVGALRADQREVVVMKIYGQLTFAQIAGVLDEPLSTVATRYQRALGEIRRLMEVKSP